MQTSAWVCFGLGIGWPKAAVLLISNGWGFFLGLLYMVFYPRIWNETAIPTVKRDYFISVGACVLVFVFDVVMFLLAVASDEPLSGDNAFVAWIGYVAMVACLLYATAPMCEFVSVFRWKNVGYMGSWQMNVAVVLTCVAWTVQGIFYLQQLQITIPNATGFFVQGAALVIRVYAKCKGWRSELPAKEDTQNEAVGSDGLGVGSDAGGGASSRELSGSGEGAIELMGLEGKLLGSSVVTSVWSTSEESSGVGSGTSREPFMPLAANS